MSSSAVNFIRKHPLMETSASPAHKRPSLTTVGGKHRLTAIAVDAQVPTITGAEAFDVVYVGTDDGRVLKFFNYETSAAGDEGNTNNHAAAYKTVIISDVQVLPPGTPITELTISRKTDALIVVSNGAIVATALNYCSNLTTCDECARVPGCAWHLEAHDCVRVDFEVDAKGIKNYLQDARATDNKLCKKFGAKGGGAGGRKADPAPSLSRGTVAGVGHVPHTGFPASPKDNEITVTSLNDRDLPILTNEPGEWGRSRGDEDEDDGDAIAANQLNTYTAQTMASSVILTSFASLVVGLVVGVYLSRRRCSNNASCLGVDQRNHQHWWVALLSFRKGFYSD